MNGARTHAPEGELWRRALPHNIKPDRRRHPTPHQVLHLLQQRPPALHRHPAPVPVLPHGCLVPLFYFSCSFFFLKTLITRNSSFVFRKCSPFSWIRPSSGCVAARDVCVASRAVCRAVVCCSVWCQWCAGRVRTRPRLLPVFGCQSTRGSSGGCKPAAEDKRELSPGGESGQH